MKKLTMDDRGAAYMAMLVPALKIPTKVSFLLSPWITRSVIAIINKGKATFKTATIYAVLI